MAEACILQFGLPVKGMEEEGEVMFWRRPICWLRGHRPAVTVGDYGVVWTLLCTRCGLRPRSAQEAHHIRWWHPEVRIEL